MGIRLEAGPQIVLWQCGVYRRLLFSTTKQLGEAPMVLAASRMRAQQGDTIWVVQKWYSFLPCGQGNVGWSLCSLKYLFFIGHPAADVFRGDLVFSRSWEKCPMGTLPNCICFLACTFFLSVHYQLLLKKGFGVDVFRLWILRKDRAGMVWKATRMGLASVAASLDLQVPLRCPSFLVGALPRNTGEGVYGAGFGSGFQFPSSPFSLFY